MNRRHIWFIITATILSFAVLGCKGKSPSVEDVLKEKLKEQLRVTNEVFFERAKMSGKGTTIRLADQIRTSIDSDGKKAATDTSIEVHYLDENRLIKVPLRITWDFREGSWSAKNVLPEDFEFIIAFDQAALDKMKSAGGATAATQKIH